MQKQKEALEPNRSWIVDKWFEEEVPKILADGREKLLQKHVVNLEDFRKKFEVQHGN